MDRSTAAVLATEARHLRTKATSLAQDKLMRRLLLSPKLTSLANTLCTIQWACSDIEKQLGNSAEDWLKELREELFRADDLLDMIKLRRVPRKRRTPAVAHAGRDFFFSIPLVLHFAAGCRLKRAVRALSAMAVKARSFTGDGEVPFDVAPDVMPANLLGRDEDMKKLIEMVNHGEPFAVVPIVGKAGSGKSTLARLVYHDQRRNFRTRILVSRSHVYGEGQRDTIHRRALPISELTLARRFFLKEEEETQQRQPPLEFTLANREGHPSLRRPEGNQEQQFKSAVEVIEKLLNGFRFLLVLLDVNKIDRPDLFEQLMQALQRAGRHGSTVILTTTDPEIASYLSRRSLSKASCSLDAEASRLTRQDSWKLFKEHASMFHLPDDHHFWHPWIIDDCDGHPLSVIIMAKKMRRKPLRDYMVPFGHQELPKVDLPRLSSELKQIYEKLIYDDPRSSLPSEKLSNCFAFLSLFPEDHRFSREELVDLWAAENSISLSQADGYFGDFLREQALIRCVGKELVDFESPFRATEYTMRELLPYFAQHVSSKNDHLALSPDSFDLLQLDLKDKPLCQHLSFVCDLESSGFPIDILFQSGKWLLRTLLLLGSSSSSNKCWLSDIYNVPQFKVFQYLRVLHVHGITCRNLLDGIGTYSNLVYLNVCQSEVETLPDSIGEFANLKILKLSDCKKLRRLPKTIKRLALIEKLNLAGCSLLAEKLRKLDWIASLVRLEHLNLSRIDFVSLPQSIGNLRNLKALILAHCCKIRRLPRSTTKLLSLETLDLEGCTYLEELPENPDPTRAAGSLGNLKFLNILHCASLTRMPFNLGNFLSNLRHLTRFVASDDAGRSLAELGPLRDLEGELWLDKLHMLTDPEVAAQINLAEKDELHALTLSWEIDSAADASETVHNSLQVVEAMQPNSKLRSLKLIRYTAEQLPSWMRERTYLTSLVEIKLFNLKNCVLPPIGQLPALKAAEISGMDAVIELGDSFHGENGSFPLLEKLTLSQMANLRKWRVQKKNNVFPKLTDVKFIHCPKLKPPSNPLPSVASVTMWMNNEKLYGDPKEDRRLLNCMTPRVLVVSLCQDLTADSTACRGIWCLVSIKELQISACENLTSLPEGIRQLTSLQSLSIVRCRNLSSIPEWFSDLASLTSLSISACTKLRSRPKVRLRRPGLAINVEGCPLFRYY
ncbi:putative disease resistance protein RGA4 [Curcuma longa]|uniref:putative disease resistance protein RGA4 n=1 Tax=Curcuma longa TaxID=136217 RepID=UPI003D9F81E9